MSSQKKKIFVSYSSKDKPFVDQLVRDISKYGIDVWEYSNGIKVGESIPSKIGEELSKADFYVIVLSPNSVTSTWVERELSSAIEIENSRNGAVFIFPVLHQDCKRPILISAKRYANFINGYQSGLEELLDAFGLKYSRVSAPKELRDQKLLDLIDRMDAIVGQSMELIKPRIPLLVRLLADGISTNLTSSVVKPTIITWRENKIKTLKDIKPEIQTRVNDWLSSENAKGLIEDIVFRWFGDIGKEVSTKINAIYLEINLDPGKGWILADLSMSIDQTLNAENLQIEFDESSVIAAVTALIETALFMIFFPDSLFLIYLIFSSLVPVILVYFGKKTKTGDKMTRNFENWASDKNIPGFARKYLLSDEKLDETLGTSTKKIREELDKNLGQKISPEIERQTSEIVQELVNFHKEKIITAFRKN